MLERALKAGRAAIRAAGARILIVSDGAGWVLDDQAAAMASYVPGAVAVDLLPPLTNGKTIHFLNRYAALDRTDLRILAERNRLILSWTHGGAGPDTTPELRAVAERFRAIAPLIHRVHISATLYEGVVERLGVDRSRIRLVPFATDTTRFRQPRDVTAARAGFGMPLTGVVIGSFQRDGEDAPKLVKGPDRLVAVAAELGAAGVPIHVLLTGPARGYVRRELAARKVGFTYLGVVPRDLVPVCYRACDAYLITSREEGGPLALLEAMASGVPVVTTPVGMVRDVIVDEKNGLVHHEVHGLAAQLRRLVEDPSLSSTLARNARETVAAYDWAVVGPRYRTELYAA